MPYTVNLTNGDVLVSVPDAQLNTNASPIRLVGKNYVGYGEVINENLVQMLEHFSDDDAPISPLQGQLWWNSAQKVLNAWTGVAWKPIASTVSAAQSPSNPNNGDFWWDETNGQLYARLNSNWILVGPSSPAGFGETGLVPVSILDTAVTPLTHIVIKVMVNDVMIGVISKDASFNTIALPGITTVQPGFTLATISPQPGFAGTASNATLFSNLPTTSFLRTDQESATQHILRVQNNGGLSVGANNNLLISYIDPNTFVTSTQNGKGVIFQVRDNGGTTRNALTLDNTGTVSVLLAPTGDQHVATKKYVDDILTGPASVALNRGGGNTINGNITPDANNIREFGSNALRFATVYATSFNGLATNSSQLGGLSASQFLRSDIATTATNTITITNNSGLTVGATPGGNVSLVVSGGIATLSSIVNSQNLQLNVRDAGGATRTAMLVTGTTGLATVYGDPTANLGIATKQYVDAVTTNLNNFLRRDGSSTITGVLTPTTNNTINIGTSGLRFNTIYATTFNGTATDSSLVNGLSSAVFMRTNANTSTSGTLSVLNDSGLFVGTSSKLSLFVSGANSYVGVPTSNNLILRVKTDGTPTDAITINASTGLATVPGNPTAALGIATKQYVDNFSPSASSNALSRIGSNTIAGNITPDGNNTRNLGTSVLRFNTIFATTFNGTATSAQYADLAERFEADAVYTPGTVVELGGAKEITAVVEDASESVFGVISDRAAYLMNAGAGSDETHPAVAMQGRVPVRVIGKVKKGERLVAAGNGVARAAQRSEWTSFNVIGRALQSKDYEAEGIVEVVVKLNA